MPFKLPEYIHPDFSKSPFTESPTVVFQPVIRTGVAPKDYHATSIYPEYFQIRKGEWVLPRESRMDCVVVLQDGDRLSVREFRHLKRGDFVACGRRENGEDGIFVHARAFDTDEDHSQKFAFRTRITRETSFSIDYDQLYDLLVHERRNGSIVWVLGPAVTFDRDARFAFARLVEKGYVQGVLAGNALATHDLEGAFFSTALGQDIYSKKSLPLGHYNHLDAINRIREEGSIEEAVQKGFVRDGIMRALVQKGVPYVLAGSIRDDGPLPGVEGDVYEAQDRMRAVCRKATTVICLATQLHAIAAGNMTPSYTVLEGGRVRPVYFFIVDMSEFAASKLANRGSLSARSILTNVQDFIVTVERGLARRSRNG
jgi:lysine-ketoglutarate reductase/saccharopine dehydrogenase-like protein (TIGR00300 family)